MDATIIVPLDGDAERVLRCFTALSALPDEPTFRVVVVDNAAVGLEGVLRMLEGDVDIVRLPRRSGLASAVAAGLERAVGNVVVLLRDAGQVQAGWLAPLVSALKDSGIAAVASVAADAPADTPAVGAPALAWRRADLDTVPQLDDALVVAALCLELARVGEVQVASASVVQSPGSRSAAARAATAPGSTPELSIVIPTLDAAGARVRRCVSAIQGATEASHEIIIVDNGAPPQGFSAPVNSGLRAARGAYLVVCNDDVEVLPGWWAPLREALDAGAAVTFPRTVEGPTREDFAAWCFALTRETLETYAVAPGEFLDPDLVVWYQDTDLLQRLRLAGNPPLHVSASTIRHGLSETVATQDAVLRAWISEQVLRDKARFEAKHGTGVAGAAR